MKQWIANTGLAGMFAILAACGTGVSTTEPVLQTPKDETSLHAMTGASGTLDTSFVDNSVIPASLGYVRISWPQSSDAYAIAVIPSNISTLGRIVVAGHTDGKFAVTRLNNDGSIYTGFGTGGANGKVKTAVGTGLSRAQAVAIQTDGRIVAAGYAYGSTTGKDFALVRYNTDGTLDTSFGRQGQNGIVRTAVSSGSGSDEINAIAIDSSGNIVVAGSAENQFAVARYLPNGRLDSSFDLDGMVTAQIDIGASTDRAQAVVLQSNKIVIAGYSVLAGSRRMALMRFDSLGVVDNLFGPTVNGRFSSTVISTINSMALTSTNKIVVAGYTLNGVGNEDFAVAQFDVDGNLDPTFGSLSTGVIVHDVSSVPRHDRAHSVAIQPDGKIVVGGFSYEVFGGFSTSMFAAIRLTSSGGREGGFGGLFTVGSGEHRAFAMTLDNNQNILLAGYTSTPFTAVREFKVAKINP
jgi:uncharacterized delta-60 repeat protein